jgi:hypothetical protein
MIPGMVNVLEQCLKEGDEESAGEIFEVFDTLLMLVSNEWFSECTARVLNHCVRVCWIGCSSFVQSFG